VLTSLHSNCFCWIVALRAMRDVSSVTLSPGCRLSSLLRAHLEALRQFQNWLGLMDRASSVRADMFEVSLEQDGVIIAQRP
jgi:hypothetical protein